MSSVMRSLEGFIDRVFRNERKLLTAGFPVVLGQGLEEPRIQPRMTFYWHPPLTAFSDEAKEGKTARMALIRGWFDRVIVRKAR